MKLNLISLIGARPQIIKHSAIERCTINLFQDRINLITIHSGQHYSPEMSEIFFREMGIETPTLNLNVGSSSHTIQTTEIMQKLDEYLDGNSCDAFLVYGDTNSTLAGALVASKRGIPLIHIEAGLRSFNKSMPEEINRIMTDHVSSLMFCPTTAAIENLKKENIFHHEDGVIDKPSVYHCGDIMYDNSLYFAKQVEGNIELLNSLKVDKNSYILATVHRQENTDDVQKLAEIFEAFLGIIQEHQIPIIFPIHPRTKKMMRQLNVELSAKILNEEKLQLIEPVGFLEMITLEKNARLILTDSGGVQKEAYFFQKPTVILRPQTEWIEIVEKGCAMLANNKDDIITTTRLMLNNSQQLQYPPIFGDGNAAEFILTKILEKC